MSDDFEERKKLFSELKAELFKRQLSNTENFDKAVLAYSMAGLGFSLGFLKDFVQMSQAAHAWLLYTSWTFFVVAVVTTISSFLVSQIGLNRQLKSGFRYYLEYNDDALKEKNGFAGATDVLNYFSGAIFIAALVSTTVFVAVNI